MLETLEALYDCAKSIPAQVQGGGGEKGAHRSRLWRGPHTVIIILLRPVGSRIGGHVVAEK
jgi:hypothetical protein